MKKKGLNSAVKWALQMTALSFVITILLTLAADRALAGARLAAALAMVALFVVLNVVTDMFGMAVATASHKPFHSMSARRVAGAAESLMFLRSADRVASFCSDVIGDVCGIVSGASSATIVILVVRDGNFDATVTALIVSGLLAGLTVGGKALGKPLAMKHNTEIVLFVGKIIHTYKRLKHKLRKRAKR
ncbi:hypothetical protein FACS18949_04830 [Clostridia bacterium]|nr:hypothetical protein FACS189425_03710 [Clostridia bacterium]GHV32785.1 hypothetical protein FACS18949_04830 [Clostridia bacterium]